MNNNTTNTNGFSCSFCGRHEDDVTLLIANHEDTTHVCIDCIYTIYDLTKDVENKDSSLTLATPLTIKNDNAAVCNLLKPKALMANLNLHVIGQEEAKKTLSVAVYNHYKRINHNLNSQDDIEILKSNILLLGPSGSGKTLLAETMAKALDVPFVIADATTLTEAGYVGEDVESILTRLLEAAGGDVKKAEIGIVFIDEIDKIAKKVVEGRQSSRDVAGEGVQQALLKIIEGKNATVPLPKGKGSGMEKEIVINTKNILFVVAGAFSGIEKIITARLHKRGKVGFSKTETQNIVLNHPIHNITTADLVEFGIIPELLGRLPVISTLDELSKDQFIQILTEPKNALTKQFQKLFNIDNVKLTFNHDALSQIVDIALERKIGARGLRSVIDGILTETMFELDTFENQEIIVTVEMINKYRKIS